MADVPQALLHGRYEVIAAVGRGGEGTLVRAVDRRHGRDVALKMRRVTSEPQEAERLLTEARTLLSLRPHPGLPLARDDFFEGDHHVLVMDWVEGVDLGEILALYGQPGLPPTAVLRWLAPVAEALTYLHSTDPPIVHGDVKPANLVLTPTGNIVLVDFGVSSTRGLRTRAGTPGYRAPEVAAGELPTRAADVFGLAATAFALLSGGPLTGILPSWNDIDRERAANLERALRHGVTTNSAHRTPTPGELVEELRAGWDSGAAPTGVVTLLATDVVSSTRLWSDLPDAALGLLAEHLLKVDRAVERHGGRRIGDALVGDATLSVFHRAGDAVLAGIDLQRDLADGRVQVHCAAHTGEAFTGDGGYAGATLSRVAQIRELADAGQVLASATTARLAAGDLSSDVRCIDLGRHRLAGFDDPEEIVAVAAEGLVVPPDPSLAPYPGLAAFQPADRELFFGREEVIEQLIALLAPGRVVAVVGASGSGKSSLLRAGVLPRLGDATLITPSAELTTAPSVAGSGPLVVDQLEELFVLCEDLSERAAFLEQLITHAGGCLVTIRADFYGHLADYPAVAASVAAHHVLLGPLTDDQLRRAIEAPAAMRGLALEPGLVEVLLGDARAEPGALPLVAHALSETWRRRDGRTLTVAGYRDAGGVRGALTQTAERLFTDLDDGDRDLLRTLLLRMVEPGEGVADTRRRVPRDELRSLAATGKVDAVLERLAAARLISLERDTAEPAHEALLREWPRLRDWIDDARHGLRLHRNLTTAAHEWELNGHEPSDLYRGGRLARALEWQRSTGPQLTPVEESFLDASHTLFESELRTAEDRLRQQAQINRRLRRSLVGVVLLLVAALTAGALAVRQSHRADRAARRASALTLAANSETVQETNPALGLALAAESAALTEPPLRDATRAVFKAHLAFANRSWQPVREPLTAHTDGAFAVAFSPDGTLLATAGGDGMVRLWDPTTGDPVGEPLAAHTDGAFAVAFSPDGTLLATAGGDGMVRLWEPTTGDPVGEPLAAHTDGAFAVAFSPDGTLLATAGGDGMVRLWEPTTGDPVGQPLTGHDGDVVELAFGRGGRLLASAGRDGIVRLWDPTGADPVGEPFTKRNGSLSAVAFNHDGTLLALGGGNGVRLSDPLTRRTIGEHLRWGQTRIMEAVAFSPDGSLLATGRGDGKVQLWDPMTGDPVGGALTGHTNGAHAVAFSADGTLLATAGGDGKVRLWDPVSGDPVGLRLTGHDGPLSTVAFNHAGTSLASAGEDGTVRLWDPTTGDPLGEPLIDHNGVVYEVTFRPDGILLASAGEDGTVRLWDPTTGDPVGGPLIGHDSGAFAVAFSSDGTLLASAGEDGTVRLWDPTTGDPVGGPLIGHDSGAFAVAFSSDGTLLASAGEDGTVRLWDPTTGDSVGEPLIGHNGVVYEVTFSPDGATLASVGGDGTVRLWDPTTGDSVGEPLTGHGRPVRAAAFSPDGTLLTTTGDDGYVRFWDPKTGDRMGELIKAHAISGSAVAFSPDGTLLASAGNDGVRVWPDIWNASAACRLAARYVTRRQVEEYLQDRSARACQLD